jgi:hypothetical protein
MSRQTISKINKNTSTFIKETGQPTKIKIAKGDIVDCMFTEKCQVIVGPRVKNNIVYYHGTGHAYITNKLV